MFKPADLFDLSQTEHAGIFEGCHYAWEALKKIESYVQTHLRPALHNLCEGVAYVGEQVFIGEGTVVEDGAMIKGPAIIGRHCQIRHNAYIREQVIIGDHCVVGNSCRRGIDSDRPVRTERIDRCHCIALSHADTKNGGVDPTSESGQWMN